MHTQRNARIRIIATAVLSAVLAGGGNAYADPHGHSGGGQRGPSFRDNGFRDHDFHDRGRFDSNFDRDRYYAPRGQVFGALPRRYDVAVHNGVRFYFGGGLWYWNERPGRFVVVAPPLGIVVPILPPFHSTVWVGPTPYYYSNNTYYVQGPQGYTVVAAPATVAAAAPQAPVAPRPPAPDEFFVYPREGQDAKQQAADREQCNEWATGQTAFDPRFGLPADDAMAPQKRADYRRALDACMDGRGYTMK